MLIVITIFTACLLVCPRTVSGQTISFKGNVASSESGIALESAAVRSNNSGVYTNADGSFKLFVSKQGLISVSHVGFSTISIASDTLTDNKDYKILLRPAITELNEITINARIIKAEEIVTKAIGNLPHLLDNNEFVLEALYRQTHYSIIPSVNVKKYTYFSEAAVLLHHLMSESTYQPIVKEIRRSNDSRYSSYNRVTSDDIAKEERRLELANGFLELDYTRYREPLKTDNLFWNPNPILCRLDRRFVKSHEFSVDSIVSWDNKDVFVIRVLPSKRSKKVETYLGVSPYVPEGLLYITDEDFHILEFHYAYVNKQTYSSNNLSANLLQYVSQGDYFFKDVVKYRMYNNKLYLSYFMREARDNTYGGGLNESGLVKSQSVDEDDFRYYRLKRELIVNRINTDTKTLSASYLTPRYKTLFPKVYEYNKTFWMNFNTTLIDKLEKKILDDLGQGISLEKQFEINQNK